ncbi:MAG: nucleotidyl transferase AbiEii/AbiGii toxin family protein [Candidatus Aminicenantes bacterium]|nr:nucleotidyl transferase AbiEii/AbiGii toxin family protein [Candidatus Aminicenantes bacterium]
MNWEKSKSLTPLKHDFLVSFFEKSRDFFLTGGSALSIFYFDHRYSYDLDFFTEKDIDWLFHERLFISIVEEIKAEYTTITKAPFFHRYELRRGKDKEIIDFVIEKVPQIDKKKNKFDIIDVDTPLEIGVNKICTLLSRTELKDVIDLFFLVKNGFNIKENIEKAKQKDGGIEPAIISYLLSQFNVSKLPDYMIEKVSIKELEDFISDLKKFLAEISFPG